jgi:hypothetical protein
MRAIVVVVGDVQLLLSHVALDHEVPLHDVDLVGVLALALPLDEGLVAQLADALVLVEHVLLDDAAGPRRGT